MTHRAKQSWGMWFITNTRVKGSIIALMLAGIVGSLVWALSSFNTTDVLPEFIIIDAAKQREFGAFTVKVDAGVYIKNFPTFDMIKNNFTVDCLVWFEFFSDEIMLNTVERFGFDNGRIIQKSSPDIKMSNGRTFVLYDVRAELKSNLRYDKFPLEDHKLTIILTNNFVTPSEMFFVVNPNSFVISPNIFISNWIIRDQSTDVGYVKPQLNTQEEGKQASYPQASFTIKFQKAGIRKVLIIFIPIFCAILLSLFSFMMNIQQVFGRSSLSISGLTALLGYRFVIEQMMPEVGYFTTTDFIYLLLLAASLGIFVFQLVTGRFIDTVNEKMKIATPPEREEYKGFYLRFEKINMGVFVLLVSIITLMTIYFVVL